MYIKSLILSIALLNISNSFANDSASISTDHDEITKSSEYINKAAIEVFGVNPISKFSFHLPNYMAAGRNDLKLQLSGKYRVANNADIYLAYTQLMFWHIYDDSMPFEEINYNPEIFYRFLEHKTRFIRSIDLGLLHTSNGEDGDVSRSINRAYAKINAVGKIGRYNMITLLQFHQFFNKDAQSEKIEKYLGYWDLNLAITHLLVHNKQHLDLHIRLFAGKKFFDFDMGGREIGLIYNFESKNFNPNLYFQYYSGYGENLLYQNIKKEEYRLGLMLSL